MQTIIRFNRLLLLRKHHSVCNMCSKCQVPVTYTVCKRIYVYIAQNFMYVCMCSYTVQSFRRIHTTVHCMSSCAMNAKRSNQASNATSVDTSWNKHKTVGLYLCILLSIVRQVLDIQKDHSVQSRPKGTLVIHYEFLRTHIHTHCECRMKPENNIVIISYQYVLQQKCKLKSCTELKTAQYDASSWNKNSIFCREAK